MRAGALDVLLGAPKVQPCLEARAGWRRKLSPASHPLHEHADEIETDARALRTLAPIEERAEPSGVARESLPGIGKAHHQLRAIVACPDLRARGRGLRMTDGVLDQVAEDDLERAAISQDQRPAFSGRGLQVDLHAAHGGF